MIIRSALSALLIIGTGVLTTALSVYGFTQEISHFTASAGTDEERISAFVTGARTPGLSSITQTSFMLDCRSAMLSPAAFALSQDQRTQLYSACYKADLAVTQANPAFSFAWLSAAHAAMATGDTEAMHDLLKRSFSTGRNEGWVAKIRAEMVQFNYGLMAPDLYEDAKRDLALLIDGKNLPAAAEIYVARPEARERITAVVETLSAQSQADFIKVVQSQMKAKAQL